jgi:hypothetical protein
LGDRPRFVSLWFGDNPQFERMARVLEFTARRHCPGWSIEVQRIAPAMPRFSPLGIASHALNTQKMDAWRDVIASAPDGDRILLIDSDTVILRSLDSAWDDEFDLAYTVKDSNRFPFNSGVVFLRAGPGARAFADAWQKENVRLLETPKEHVKWRSRYGGCNQAALGAMLEGGVVSRLGLRVVKLPCLEWNCEDSSWAGFDPARTRIVHLKSGLRRAVFALGPMNARLARLAHIWKALEREAGGPPPAPGAVVAPSLSPRVARLGWRRLRVRTR